MKSNFKYRVDDWVEVRTKEEILCTLDSNGRLEGMPFMPEMLQFCGKRFQVHKRAHKTCDYSTEFPNYTRNLKNTVHLETRCSGEAHDGCQSGCLLYWKHAWLKPVTANGEHLVQISPAKAAPQTDGPACTEARLWESLYPRLKGTIPVGQPTPVVALNLMPGEWVRVKSHREILGTVTTENKNRGMIWDAELLPYCGKMYRVLRRVDRLIDEKTSKMMEMKSPCIVLESVVCQARYSRYRMLCPKQMFPFWREIWLERVDPVATQSHVAEASETNTGAV